VKDFNVALNDLIESYRNHDEPGIRFALAQEMRTQAELIWKGDPWPAEEKASEAARKAGLTATAEPTEAEMKRAAADEEAAALARQRGIEDDYSTDAAPEVPQSAKDAKTKRDLKEAAGIEEDEDDRKAKAKARK
jgi:hypothetical protein